MARQDVHIHTLAGGEVSFDALARVDQEKLAQACEMIENIVPGLIGRGRMRSGTEYLGAINNNASCRMIPYKRSVSTTAALELTDSTLRVWANDALVTRAAVTSTVTNGTFGSSTGWKITLTDGAECNINSSSPNQLFLRATGAGSRASCRQAVTTSSPNIEHALRIVVQRGPVKFRCGSAAGLDDYISETTLETGYFSLSFTPTGTYYIEFFTSKQTMALVTSCTVEGAGIMTLPAPWVAAELRQIKWDMSIDVMYVTHADWQQHKIERRGNTSWGICLFKSDDGPFLVSPTASVQLTPADNEGNTTLTASAPFFQQNHVGALFKITHARTQMQCSLSAVETYTEAFKAQGIGNDHSFDVAISGTFVGTVRVQRSLLGPDIGFSDVTDAGTYSYTSPGAWTGLNAASAQDNQIAWYRVGFKSGEYTSGTAVVRVTYKGYGDYGIARVTGYQSSTVVFAEVLKRFWNTYASDKWQEGSWSFVQGFPSSVGFHDGRLWFGSSSSPAGSVADNYYSFATQERDSAGNYAVTDDASIQRDIAISGGINEITDMISLQRLIMFSDAAEIVARADAFDKPLTPTVCSYKAASTIGSTALVMPVKMDKRAFYVNAIGDKLYQLIFNFQQQDYDSDCMWELNEYIGCGGPGGSLSIVALAVQRHPDTYIWALRSDGQLIGMLYSEKQEVNALFRLYMGSDGTVDGVIEDLIVLPQSNSKQRLYVVVRRIVNGQTVRYYEKLAEFTEGLGASVSKLLDCGKFFAGPATTVSVPHLAGRTVYAWGNGTNLGSFTADGSGNVNLGVSATNIWVGLPYVGRFKSAKLAYGARMGTALLKPKQVSELGILASNILPNGVQYGVDFDHLYPLPVPGEGADVGGSGAVQSVIAERPFVFDGSWDTDARVCLRISPNTPATINGIVIGMATNEG